MRKCFLPVLLLALALCAAGCAQRHYLGLHGPTVRRFPDAHAGVSEDRACLQCHHPQGDRFVGCLKCHDDAI